MPISNIFIPGPVVVAGSSTFTLSGIKDRSDDSGTQMVRNVAAGVIATSFGAIISQNPMIKVTTTDLKTFLDNISTMFSFFTPQTTVFTTVAAYYAKLDATQSAGIASGSTHMSLTANKTLWAPGAISANQGEEATLSFDIHCLYDGSNEPLIPAASVALPAAATLSKFTLGEVFVNGSNVNGVVGVTLDPGVTVEVVKVDGQVWPTTAFVVKQEPTITIRTNEPVNWSTFGLDGTALGANSCAIYFRKLANDGSVVADATQEHIEFITGASQGIIYPVSGGGNAGAVATCELMIAPRAGSNALWTIDTTADIP